MSRPLYRDLNTVLRSRFGCRVQKISVDAGLTCPNRDGTKGLGGCIYCNRLGSGTGASASQTIREQVITGKKALQKRYGASKFIAYFQSFSNTYAPADKLEGLYREALSVPDVAGLEVGTRPDCLEDDVLDLLARLGNETYVCIELGLQSAHDRTLRLINRGHDFSRFAEGTARCRARGLDVCVHVILGLPGEDRNDMLDTARTLSAMDIQGIKIHLLYVIKGTPLHDLYEAGKYRCLEREEYYDLVGDFLSLLNPSMAVHRLTGDPHPAELAAPLWALEKQKNLNSIRERLSARQLWQGKHFRNPFD
ncbi:MAG: TIGR01212 family radical SAM protein [Syntrophales bacterium]|nr:TIGR01212 family radical SAM protein [Syntrophales bacterium]